MIQNGKYGAINKTDTTKKQKETTFYGEIITTIELFVKSQYMKCIQYNTKYYW